MKTYSNDKIYTIFQVIVFIIVLALTFYYYGLPSLKDSFGSSDSFINEKEYSSIIEIRLSSGPNFIFITSKDKKITNILFLNTQSTCLYNQNIENKSLKDAIEKTIEQLYNKDYLSEDTIVEIIEYPENNDYIDIIEEFTKKTSQFNITIQESKTTLTNKITELSLTREKGKELKTIENYSKRLISNYKDQLLIAEYEKAPTITKNLASNYANKVYEKLSLYAMQVLNQELADTSLPIHLIPADGANNIYPTENSWYYIKEHKVYAYIEFIGPDNTYSYCYNGEISLRKEGECDEEFSQN